MPHKILEPNIISQAGRAKLPRRKEPYFRSLPGSSGLKVGYRAGANTWVAVAYDIETKKRTYSALGTFCDDVLDAQGKMASAYDQAVRAAEAWAKRTDDAAITGHEVKKTYTVKDACDDYMKEFRRLGKKSADRTEGTINAHILPSLGAAVVAKLTEKRLTDWLDGVANSPARLRTKKGQPQRFKKPDTSENGIRARRATANRVLTVLKAALNFAHAKKKAPSALAWEGVKPFGGVTSARIRYLNDDESRRLVNACTVEFRPLVVAGLLTGARYSELTRLVTCDFNIDAGTIHIRVSKSSKARHIHLSDEGMRHFKCAVAGKAADAAIFTKADGRLWAKDDQTRPMAAAVDASKIGKLTFHELRHSYASKLVMAGVPLAFVADQLGHADTRMVSKHYGHLAPSVVADAVRAAMGTMGIVEGTNVVSLARNG